MVFACLVCNLGGAQDNAVAGAGREGEAGERDQTSETIELDGLPIVRIIFVRSDIFDTSQPKTSGWPYRAANALHIKTKERFLRSMLLFTEGDPFSAPVATESARILRATGFLNPVDITASQVEGGVEVTVATRDQWTLEVGTLFGSHGGRNKWGFEFQETNFVGMGKWVELKYRSDNERETWIYGYKDPNIRGSRWRTELRYEDSSDGFLERVRVDRPFYSLATPRAWGGEWERERLNEHLYAESDSVISGRQDTELWNAWYGMRLPGEGPVTHRLVVGYEHRRDRFRDWVVDQGGTSYPAPENRSISGPRIAYQQVVDRFEVLEGFRAWTIQEDVAMGPNFGLGATISLPDFGGDEDRVVLDGSLDGAWHSNGWLLLGESWFEGRFDAGDARNWTLGAEITLSRLGRRGWQFRAFAENSHNLDLERQLTLGADVGLRGWEPDYFDGTGRAVANVQWRTLLKKDVFQILAIGLEVFVDAGVSWAPRVGRDTDGVRTNAGLGLLGDLTTIGLANVLRVEVAWPDDGSGPTVIVTSEALF